MTEEMKERENSGFWLGVILGGLVGAVLALFAATDDKEEIKKNLLKKGKILLRHLGDLKEGIEDKGEEIKAGVTEKFEEVKEVAQEKVEEIPEVAQEAVEKVQDEANKAIANVVKAADKTENRAHQQARKFFLKKGKPLVKK